jgi:hypothetical protein
MLIERLREQGIDVIHLHEADAVPADAAIVILNSMAPSIRKAAIVHAVRRAMPEVYVLQLLVEHEQPIDAPNTSYIREPFTVASVVSVLRVFIDE